MKTSINTRIATWLAAVALPLLLGLLASYLLLDTKLTDRFEQRLERVSGALQGSVERELGLYEAHATALSEHALIKSVMLEADSFRLRKRDSALIAGPSPEVGTIDLRTNKPMNQLVSVLNAQRDIAQTGISNFEIRSPDGKLLGRSGDQNWQPSEPSVLYRSMKQKKRAYDQVVNFDRAAYLPLITPIYGDQGRTIGALTTLIPVDHIIRSINEHELGLAETQAYVQFKSSEGNWELLSQLRSDGNMKSRAAELLENGSSAIALDRPADSSSDLVSTRNIAGTNWGLVVTQPQHFRSDVVGTLKTVVLVALIISIVLLGAGFWLVLRPFSTRLLAVRDASEKLVHRDYSFRIGDTIVDATGDIARHIDQVAGELNEGVTVQVAVKERIQEIEDKDDLTGLFNEKYVSETLQRLVAQPGSLPVTFAVICSQGYQDLKDAHGSQIAEEILPAIALRLHGIVDHQCELARLHSSDFLVISRNTDADHAVKLKADLEQAFTTSFETSAGEMLIGCQIGITTAESTADIESAFNQAKDTAANGLEVGGAQSARQRERIRLVESAIEAGRMAVWFQPILRLGEGAAPVAVGAEAFVRISDEAGTVVAPNSFVPEIQNAPVAGLLDRIVIGKSLETLAKWTQQQKIPQDFFLSVNVSRYSLLSDDVVGYLQSALEKLSIQPERLILEVSGCGPGMDVQAFSGIKQLGVKIAMDDVGLKYGNFELYTNIQPDYAKLDQRRIDESRNPQALADQENRLSVLWQSLGLEIIAKSIESADQIGKLAGRGITLVQGYVFDQPRDAGEFVEYWGLHTPDDELPSQLRKTG